jgi:4-aminobutyrate aminotransferase-like enzyme
MPERDDPCGPGRFFAPTRSIRIRTTLPGPRSQVILDRQRAATGISSRLPLVTAYAHGARLIDADNNVFIDFAGGLRSTEVGYTPESVVERLKAQAELTHATPGLDSASEAEIQLCELLNKIAPFTGGTTHTRVFTTRPALPGEMYESLTGTMPDIHPAIADETRIGIGRTGRWFACEHHAPLPDAILYGGTLGAGLPLYALTGKADVVDQVQMAEPANPLICVAALEAVRLMREHNLPARAAQLGSLLDERYAEWADMLSALHIVISGQAAWRTLHLSDMQAAARLQSIAFHNGLLLATEDTSIPLRFPLMIPEEQFHEGLDVLEAALGTLRHG